MRACQSIFIFLVIVASYKVFADSGIDFNKRWKLIRDNDVSIVWKSRDNHQVYGSVTIKKREKESSNALMKDKSFMSSVLNKKKKMLTFTGITNWKVNSKQWLKNKIDLADVLYLKGVYRDHNGVDIRFIEVHKYSKSNVTQVLYTEPKSSKENSRLTKSLFRKYGVQI